MTKETLLQELSESIAKICGIRVHDVKLYPEGSEIYTQELHLEHVLRAIPDKQQDNWIIRPDGQIYHDTNPYGGHYPKYNLTLPFESQPIEMLQFLHDIICK